MRNNNNPTYKDSPLGKIPSDWEVKQLGELGQLISGLHLNPDAYNKVSEGIPYFTGPTDYTNDIMSNHKMDHQEKCSSYKWRYINNCQGIRSR